MSLELVLRVKCFNGFQKIYRHFSEELGCSMKFSLYEPESITTGVKFNVLYYLSGLSCTEENFIIKSGFQKYANEHKFIVVGPDTSPRGLNLPGENDNWDFGEGASYYLDAVKEPWSKHYRMYSYVTKELPKLIQQNFPTTGRNGIFGHSMGGHGALVCGLRNPDLYQSISAFAPMTNPIFSRKDAYRKYLGDSTEEVKEWSLFDSCEIAKHYSGPPRDILIDQGLEDEFLEMLKPGNLQLAIGTKEDKLKVTLRLQEGYGHSYYFVSSFIKDHFEHHSKILNQLQTVE